MIGAGPIGIGAYFALKARGLRSLIVSETSANRRAVLRKMGVEHVIDPAERPLDEQVAELTSGLGVGIAVDCAGDSAAFSLGMQSLGLAGHMLVLAGYQTPTSLSPRLLYGGKTLSASMAYTRADFAAVIDAMAHNHYSADGWVECVGFEDVKAAIQDLQQGKRVKVLVASP